MGITSKIIITAAAAVVTVAVAAKPASAYFGQTYYEKQLNRLSEHDNFSYRNVEKSFGSRKDVITVVQDANGIRSEFVFNVSTEFAFGGFKSDFNVDYNASKFTILDDAVKIKEFPQNSGTVDFTYAGARAVIEFKNDPVEFTFRNFAREVDCRAGKSAVTVEFNEEQLHRDSEKALEYFAAGADPMKQKAVLESINCGDGLFAVDLKNLTVDSEMITLDFVPSAKTTFENLNLFIPGNIQLSSGRVSAGLDIAREKGGDRNTLSLSLALDRAELADSPDGAGGETPEEEAPGDDVEVPVTESKAPLGKTSFSKADFSLTLNKLTDEYLAKVYSGYALESPLGEAAKLDNIDVEAAVNLAEEHGSFSFDGALQSSKRSFADLRFNIGVSAEQELVRFIDRTFAGDVESEIIEPLVKRKYISLKNGKYSTRVSCDRFPFIMANGKLLDLRDLNF